NGSHSTPSTGGDGGGPGSGIWIVRPAAESSANSRPAEVKNRYRPSPPNAPRIASVSRTAPPVGRRTSRGGESGNEVRNTPSRPPTEPTKAIGPSFGPHATTRCISIVGSWNGCGAAPGAHRYVGPRIDARLSSRAQAHGASASTVHPESTVVSALPSLRAIVGTDGPEHRT